MRFSPLLIPVVFVGSYVIIEPAEEADKTKVQGDIVAVLFPDHIKKYKQQGVWPFEDQLSNSLGNDDQESGSDGDDNEDDDDNDLFVNNNRVVIEESDTDSESEDETDEDDK